MYSKLYSFFFVSNQLKMELLMRKKWILIFVCLLGMSMFLMSETSTVVTNNTSDQEKEEESPQKQKEKEKVEKKEKLVR